MFTWTLQPVLFILWPQGSSNWFCSKYFLVFFLVVLRKLAIKTETHQQFWSVSVWFEGVTWNQIIFYQSLMTHGMTCAKKFILNLTLAFVLLNLTCQLLGSITGYSSLHLSFWSFRNSFEFPGEVTEQTIVGDLSAVELVQVTKCHNSWCTSSTSKCYRLSNNNSVISVPKD